MFKQKLVQFNEWVRLKRELKETEAQIYITFREGIAAEAKISIFKPRDFISAWRRPHDYLFGTKEYPCIVNHQWEKTFCGGGIYCAEIESHHCKKYIEHSVCPNTDCLWYGDNRAAAEAWQKWQDTKKHYADVKEQYNTVRQQLFGKLLGKKQR